MTTPKRIWYEGASYHITARGNHRNDIFRDEEDFQYYLTIVEEALFYYGNYNYQIKVEGSFHSPQAPSEGENISKGKL